MDRYEIGHPAIGVIGFCDTKVEAFTQARRRGPLTTVYDRMARHGAWQLWHVSDIPPYALVYAERRPQ